jgi:hypothetical protein
MSKIHLLFKYGSEHNKYLIIFINNITDYAYQSKDFLNVCRNSYQNFIETNMLDPEDICNKLKKDIVDLVSENLVEVTYIVYVAFYPLIYYQHRFPHGKKNSFMCEKIMFMEIESDLHVTRDDVLDISTIILPADGFKVDKLEKNSDGILMHNENSIFFDLSEEEYKRIKHENNTLIKECENKFKITIKNVFCIK